MSERFRQAYANNLRALAEVHELQQKHQAAGNRREDDKTVLGKLAHLRMTSSLSKVDACVRMTNDLIDQHECVVIFVNFVETGEKLKERFNEGDRECDFMSGKITNADKRAAMVEKFQRGDTDVLICTFGVGGVGITLTKAK